MTTAVRPMLHCILRDPPRPAVLTGGLRWIDVYGLGAVVGDLEPGQVRAADRERLQDYADRISLIHRDETLIPMRFGCVCDSDEAICRLINRHRSRLLALLDDLDDCAEFGIRLLLPAHPPAATSPPPPAHADARPGHSHLAAIRMRVDGEALAAQRARQAGGALERAVAGLFRDRREEFAQIGGRDLLSVYFLVPRGTAAAFVEQLQADPSLSSGTGLITGPWPPYNFVGALDDDIRSLV